ncbi:MAG: hypothetical protein JXQ96_02180 [Cyclobacteriaceae bacterium]
MLGRQSISTKGTFQIIAAIALALFSFFSFVEGNQERPQEVHRTEMAKSTWKQTRPFAHFQSNILPTTKKEERYYFIRYEIGNISRFHNLRSQVQFDCFDQVLQNNQFGENAPIHKLFIHSGNDEEDAHIG